MLSVVNVQLALEPEDNFHRRRNFDCITGQDMRFPEMDEAPIQVYKE